VISNDIGMRKKRPGRQSALRNAFIARPRRRWPLQNLSVDAPKNSVKEAEEAAGKNKNAPTAMQSNPATMVF